MKAQMRARETLAMMKSPKRSAGIVFLASTLVFLAGLPSLAQAADGWQEAAGGAVAILPNPVKADGIVGGSLVCAEQAWNFRLRTDASAQLPTDDVSMVIDGDKIPAKVRFASGVITIPVSHEVLDPLKAGMSLAFVFGKEKTAPAATFALRGSKKVLEAVAPRCSQIDMSAYHRVAISQTDPAVEEARPLLADEAALFRDATKKEPVLAAATVALPEGRGMLFATLCGSTWYYGRSGCTLTGFVRASAAEDWRAVYNSEGVALYTDPGARNGDWPNIVTLPVSGGIEPSHFVWTGLAYELRDHIVAEQDQFVEGQGDMAQ